MADETGPVGPGAWDDPGRADGDLSAWQVAEIRKAVTEADRGGFATDEVVDALFRKWGALGD